MNISVIDPIAPAIERTKLILFQPFDLGKWFVLGFCCFLADLGEGGGASFNFSGDVGDPNFKPALDWVQDHLAIVIAIVLCVLLVSLLIGLVITWISSRGKFMFLDGIVNNRGAVIEPWREYLPPERKPRSILELGSGTGNLSTLLAQRFPAAQLRLVDVSAESLDICRSRLGSDPRFVFERLDFRDLAIADGAFDLIISSISIHHLRSPEKQTLFASTHRWLANGGVFAFSDQFAGATEDLYRRHLQHWRQQAFDAGATLEEWELWMRHQAEHDHHDPLPAQIDWLRSAGYSTVDCPWRYLLWAVVQARK